MSVQSATRGQQELSASCWYHAGELSVAGMGIALPGAALTTAELLHKLEQNFNLGINRRAALVSRQLGVKTRYLCRDLNARAEAPRATDSNPSLGARAVSAALKEAGMTIADVSFLIGHTATPATQLPPNIASVADRLGYRGPFLELRQACTGFASALVVASGLLASSSTGAVVIVGSETGSPYFDPLRAQTSTDQLINVLMMGDAAAAIVLSAGGASSAARLSHLFYGQNGVGIESGLALRAGGSNQAFGNGAVLEFEHNFAEVRRHGAMLFECGIVAAQALGIDLSEVDKIIPHQANGHMDELLAKHFGIERERVFVNANAVGNTGSAAIWLALAQLRAQLRPGQTALALGAEATKYMYGGFLYTHA